jgi:hypothetical protein
MLLASRLLEWGLGSASSYTLSTAEEREQGETWAFLHHATYIRAHALRTHVYTSTSITHSAQCTCMNEWMKDGTTFHFRGVPCPAYSWGMHARLKSKLRPALDQEHSKQPTHGTENISRKTFFAKKIAPRNQMMYILKLSWILSKLVDAQDSPGTWAPGCPGPRFFNPCTN